MKRSCIPMVFCVLVVGCDAASTSITGPAPGPTDNTTFTLAGRVQDRDGVPISGAAVQLDGATERQTALSDERGEYRITGLRGRFAMTVTRDSYSVYKNTVFVAADQTIVVTLLRPSVLVLTAGVTLRGTITGPPCDPNWDAQAPCVQVNFTPPETGLYEFLVIWKGPSAVDLLIDHNVALYWESYTGEIRATVPMQAGVRRELRLHSYHLPYLEEAFELTASLKAGP